MALLQFVSRRYIAFGTPRYWLGPAINAQESGREIG